MKKSFIIFFFLIFVLQSCFLLNLPRRPRGRTNPNPQKPSAKTEKAIDSFKKVTAKFKTLATQDYFQVWVKVDVERFYGQKDINAFLNEFDIVYDLAENYSSYNNNTLIQQKQQVNKNSDNVYRVGQYYYISFNIPRQRYSNLVTRVHVIDRKYNVKITEYLTLQYFSGNIRQTLSLYDKTIEVPLFYNYLNRKDTIRLKTVNQETKVFKVLHYQKDFDASKPPFSKVETNDKLSELTPKRTFEIKTNQALSFDQSGLYVIQINNKKFDNYAFYVSPNRYPKLSNFHDLTKPLVYITTQEEIQALKNSETPKKALDTFWLKIMSADVSKAKRTIKLFYERVKSANEFFTTYKEGWKTDMGMIYTIFGRPNVVRRSATREEWTYKNTSQSNIRFNFIKKSNRFSPTHYVLQRYEEYEQVWYKALDAIRSGQIN